MRARRVLRAAIGLAAAVSAASPGAATGQQPRGGGITLDAAVSGALRDHPVVERARHQLEASHGDVVVSGARFASALAGSVGSEREALPAPEVGPSGLVRTQTSYSLQLQSLTRVGILLQPEVSVRRTDVPGTPEAMGSAAVRMRVDVPLMRDRWGRASTAPERSARALHRADGFGLAHASATAVHEAVGTYWALRAAEERLEVQRAAERRAEQLARETQLLVEADERAASDLNQARGTLAMRRMARLAAEQGVAEARQRLALAMGRTPADLPHGATATAFPEPQSVELSPAALAALVETGRANRADLAAARARAAASELLIAAAREQLRPQVSVSVTLGYNNSSRGPGFDQLLVPLYTDIPGLNAGLALQYRLPITRSEALGQMLQREAAREQLRTTEDELLRRIESGIQLAAAALQRSARSLQDAAEAVDLLSATVAAERKRFQLGSATLFDILNAEDALTNALLAAVTSRHGYAVALVTLRYETGTLVELEGDGAAVPDLELLLEPR